jgi:hypothetical protein
MLLFQKDRLKPISLEFVVEGNIVLEPVFEVIQLGLLHDDEIHPAPKSSSYILLSSQRGSATERKINCLTGL